MKSVKVLFTLLLVISHVGCIEGAPPNKQVTNPPQTPSMTRTQAPAHVQNKPVQSTPVQNRAGRAHSSAAPRLLPTAHSRRTTGTPTQRVSTRSTPVNAQAQQQLHSHLRQRVARQQTVASPTTSAAVRQRIHHRAQTAGTVRQGLAKNYPDRHKFFDHSFWEHHHSHPHFWHQGFNSWNYAPWTQVNNWIGLDASTPAYYYDQGEPQVLGPVEQEMSVGPPPADTDWVSLGVFALLSSEDSSADPYMFFQLALGKDGTISGTYYNEDTDQAYPLQGLVDRQTQRAVWIAVAESSTIFETGLYNLTLSETPVEVHFGQNETQQWMMVRVNEGQNS